MIAVQAHDQGSILPVRAKAGAKADSVLDEHNGALRVSVTAPPEGGKANEAIIRVLAGALGLRKAQLILVSGETAREKKFLVTGVSAHDLLNRIDAALSPTLYDPAIDQVPPPAPPSSP